MYKEQNGECIMMLVREGLIGLLVMTVESGSTGFDSYWEHSEFYFS